MFLIRGVIKKCIIHLNKSINRTLHTWIRCSLAPRANLAGIHFLILKGNREQIVLAPSVVHNKGRIMRWLHTSCRWGNRRKPEILELHYWSHPVSNFASIFPYLLDALVTKNWSPMWKPRVTTSGYCSHVPNSEGLSEANMRPHPQSLPSGLFSEQQCLKLLCPHQWIINSWLKEEARCTCYQESSELLTEAIILSG